MIKNKTITTKEFWDKYINENILEIFEITYDFFSQELPKEFTENYDVEAVILETKGNQATAKNFENVVKFTELLQKKHPKLYENNFQYFDYFLIDYYCFNQDKDKTEHSFKNLISNPTKDFEVYQISFKKLLFYGYTDILNRAISQNYETVQNSDKLLETAGFDLAICKFHLTLEEFYLNDNFDIKTFSSTLEKYDFTFNNELLSTFETGMSKQLPKEDIINNFQEDRVNFFITLQIYFLKYMKKRKFSFATSGWIWNKMQLFLPDNKKKKCKPNDYFQVKIAVFERFLVSLSEDIFIDNKSEIIATLWGSVYLYDFLKSIDIIQQDTYDNYIETTRILKGKVIANFISDLWNSNFVHIWEKPDSVSTTEFIEEEKIFKKSINFKHHKFADLRSEISEELEKIGSLSTYIIEGSKTLKKQPLLDNLFSSFPDDETYDNKINEPFRAEKKIGRNAPCPCGSGKKYKKCCGR